MKLEFNTRACLEMNLAPPTPYCIVLRAQCMFTDAAKSDYWQNNPLCKQ